MTARRRHAGRALLLTALAPGAALALTGCMGGWLGVGAAGAGGFAAAAHRAGPTVAIDNQSSTDVRITYWVGEVDVTAPGGVTGWRSDWDHNFVLASGRKDARDVGHNGYDASTSDSVVRVRIEAAPGEVVGPTVRPTQHAGVREYWLGFDGPPPYRLRVFGDEGGLTFESYGEGGLRAVPEEGRFPYRNESQASPSDPYAG